MQQYVRQAPVHQREPGVGPRADRRQFRHGPVQLVPYAGTCARSRFRTARPKAIWVDREGSMSPKKVDDPALKTGSRSTVSAKSVSLTHQAPKGSRKTSAGLRRAKPSRNPNGSRRKARMSPTPTKRPLPGAQLIAWNPPRMQQKVT